MIAGLSEKLDGILVQNTDGMTLNNSLKNGVTDVPIRESILPPV